MAHANMEMIASTIIRAKRKKKTVNFMSKENVNLAANASIIIL
jgi:hypothetical protein